MHGSGGAFFVRTFLLGLDACLPIELDLLRLDTLSVCTNYWS